MIRRRSEPVSDPRTGGLCLGLSGILKCRSVGFARSGDGSKGETRERVKAGETERDQTVSITNQFAIASVSSSLPHLTLHRCACYCKTVFENQSNVLVNQLVQCADWTGLGTGSGLVSSPVTSVPSPSP